MPARKVAVWVCRPLAVRAEHRRCHSEPSATMGPANGENRSFRRPANEITYLSPGPSASTVVHAADAACATAASGRCRHTATVVRIDISPTPAVPLCGPGRCTQPLPWPGVAARRWERDGKDRHFLVLPSLRILPAPDVRTTCRGTPPGRGGPERAVHVPENLVFARSYAVATRVGSDWAARSLRHEIGSGRESWY